MATSEIPRLVATLVWEGIKLGPLVSFRMLLAAGPWAFDVSKAGALSSIVAVDAERQAGIAAIAFTLAKLGFPGLVASMTHQIILTERPDAVVKISLEGMFAGYFPELLKVNNQLIEQGCIGDANIIAKAMAEHGHAEFVQMLTNGPLKAVTEPIVNAVKWVVGDGSQLGDEKKMEDSAEVVGKDKVPSIDIGHDSEKEEEEEEGEKEEDETLTNATL